MASEAQRAEVEALLKAVDAPVLSELSETDLVRLAGLCTVTAHVPGDAVVDAHETPADRMHVVLNGTFGVTVASAEGEVEVVRIGRGETFGHTCFITSKKRCSSLTCCNTGRLVVIHMAHVKSVLGLRCTIFLRQAAEEAEGILLALAPLRTNLTDHEDEVGRSTSAKPPVGHLQRVESWQSLDLTPHDVLLDELIKYISLRTSTIARTMHGSGFTIRMPCFDEFQYTMQKTNLDRDRRVIAYGRLKGLWYSLLSNGYCPSFNPTVRENRITLHGDRDVAEKAFEQVGAYDALNMGSHWDGMLLDPCVVEQEGETYVEILIEQSSHSGCDICFGVCGGTHDVGNGAVAWKQKDGMMYYCSSGFKYNKGQRLEFSSARKFAKCANIGDRIGMLVDTRPMSRINPGGPSVSLYVNDEYQGVMFSHNQMQKLQPGFEWPETLYFALDLKVPGQRVRILRERTFCSLERSIKFSDMAWDPKAGHLGAWKHRPVHDRTWLDAVHND